MTDLDIQIDDPDDEIGAPVRVLNGDSIPPWIKAVTVLVLGAAIVLIIAFWFGRLKQETTPSLEPAAPATAPLTSTTVSPAIEVSLRAIDGWEQFARSGELSSVVDTFHPDGPQLALFHQAAVPGSVTEVAFAATNLSEARDGDLTIVSLDLEVTSQTSRATYPFDLVYLAGSDQVWTVVDRRAPDAPALPPAPVFIEAAQDVWGTFTVAMAAGDGAAVAPTVTADSLLLADQVVAAVAGAEPTRDPAVDNELFARLVSRGRQLSVADSGQALVAALDQGTREAIQIGELTDWRMADTNRLVASLEIGGEPVALVPFLLADDVWAFDLKGALESSDGGTP